MEKMQEFIDFIFFEVWCKAPSKKPFGLELFNAKAELQEVMSAFYYSDKKNADFFYGSVERIFGHFKNLNTKQIRRLKWWYQSNNNIEKLCTNSESCIARYSDIEEKFPSIAADIKIFFSGLYDFDAAALKKKTGDIDDHYTAFITVNNKGTCPFCGINELLGKSHSHREAYDHYLPKAIYPFNSINFRNLAPACHHCNSSYKGIKNPTYTPKDPAGGIVRRKAFYPFSTQPYCIDLKVTLLHADIEKLAPADIDLSFNPPSLTEEIATWKDVYGIEERYRAKFLSAGAKAWLEEVLTEQRWHNESSGAKGRAPEVYLEAVSSHASSSPYTNENFLKYGFLQACQAVGIFD
ncbi:HNH endonuclease [Pseudomonas yamanorum]